MISMSREEQLEALVNEATAQDRDLGAESRAVTDEIEKSQKQDRIKVLSVKDRLRRRILSGYIDLPFKDQDGTFHVRMKLPEPDQTRRMIQLQMQAEKVIDETPEDAEEQLVNLDRQMCELMADLCMDLDADYIQAGKGFGRDVIQDMMGVITGARPVNMEDYQFFRSPPDRP